MLNAACWICSYFIVLWLTEWLWSLPFTKWASARPRRPSATLLLGTCKYQVATLRREWPGAGRALPKKKESWRKLPAQFVANRRRGSLSPALALPPSLLPFRAHLHRMFANKAFSRFLLITPLLFLAFQSFLVYQKLNFAQNDLTVSVESTESFAPKFPRLFDPCVLFGSRSCPRNVKRYTKSACIFVRTSLKHSPLDVFATVASLINAGTKYTRIQIILVDVEERGFMDLKPLAEQLNDIYEAPVVSFMHRPSKFKDIRRARGEDQNRTHFVTDKELLTFFAAGGRPNTTRAYLASPNAFCNSVLITDAGHLYSEFFLSETGFLLGTGHRLVTFLVFLLLLLLMQLIVLTMF